MQKVLVISFSDLARDSRVNRQLRFLREDHCVRAAGLADPALDGVDFLPLRLLHNPRWRKLRAALLLACRCHETYYWSHALIQDALARLSGVQADLIVANDLVTLPLALKLAGPVPVLFDAHEYAPREFDDSFVWRQLVQPHATALCRRYVPRVSAMLTVAPGIADAYEELTGVRPVVMTNAPDYEELSPRPAAAGRSRRVLHGAAIPARHLERTLELMDHLDKRFELTLYLTPGPDPAYMRFLEEQARRRPQVRLLPPVPMRALPRVLNDYDVGVFLLEPVNFNYKHALPNKLFEFIQGRLAVAIGPSVEMVPYVRDTDCGVIAANFQPRSLARCLQRLGPADIDRCKHASHAAARRLSAEENGELFRDLVARVLAGQAQRRAG